MVLTFLYLKSCSTLQRNAYLFQVRNFPILYWVTFIFITVVYISDRQDTSKHLFSLLPVMDKCVLEKGRRIETIFTKEDLAWNVSSTNLPTCVVDSFYTYQCMLKPPKEQKMNMQVAALEIGGRPCAQSQKYGLMGAFVFFVIEFIRPLFKFETGYARRAVSRRVTGKRKLLFPRFTAPCSTSPEERNKSGEKERWSEGRGYYSDRPSGGKSSDQRRRKMFSVAATKRPKAEQHWPRVTNWICLCVCGRVVAVGL